MEFPLHVEVVHKKNSRLPKETIQSMVKLFLESRVSVSPGLTLEKRDFEDCPNVRDHVTAITFCDINQKSDNINVTTADMRYHIYRLRNLGCEIENMCDDGTDNELPAANHWQLPSEEFYGLWENLIYDTSVKEDTLNFVETTLLFSDRSIDSNIINWNRVILLHGPPGTGKTSLCKALAQKLSIRLASRYARGQLVEINSHSLFSKYFSESGKLVMKLFMKIREIIEDPQVLVCVLIDEVESLTHARKAAFSGMEPSDSIRVVNAILTQLDQIRKFPNVLILTTSNMTGAIDLAFVDRADIKQYIGPPSAVAIYQIYQSCINELMRVGIVAPMEQLFSIKILQMCQFVKNESTESSLELFNLANFSVGLSGRTLRKIPFLAHALFISSASTDLKAFLVAMKSAVKKHLADSDIFAQEIEGIKIHENGI